MGLMCPADQSWLQWQQFLVQQQQARVGSAQTSVYLGLMLTGHSHVPAAPLQSHVCTLAKDKRQDEPALPGNVGGAASGLALPGNQ